MDIKNLSEFEFENLTGKLLKTMGFSIEETLINGEDYVDLLAFSSKPMFKGSYIIQCRRSEDDVEEVTIQDFHGLAASKNISKSIIITNAYFTHTAKAIADSLNVELIDGDMLLGLIKQYQVDDKINVRIAYRKDFYTNEDFDIQKYNYYKNKIEIENKEVQHYFKLFEFLYSYVLSFDKKVVYGGLLNELLNLTEDIIKKFGGISQKGREYKSKMKYFQSLLYMLSGDLYSSFEIMQDLGLHRNIKGYFKLDNTIGVSRSGECIGEFKFEDSAKQPMNELVLFKMLGFKEGYEYLVDSFVNSIVHSMEGYTIDIKAVEEEFVNILEKRVEIELPIFQITQSGENYFLHYSYRNDVDVNGSTIVENWGEEKEYKNQFERIKFLMTV